MTSEGCRKVSHRHCINLVTNKVSYRHRDERADEKADVTSRETLHSLGLNPCVSHLASGSCCVAPWLIPLLLCAWKTLKGLTGDVPPTVLRGSFALSQSPLSSSCCLFTPKVTTFWQRGCSSCSVLYKYPPPELGMQGSGMAQQQSRPHFYFLCLCKHGHGQVEEGRIIIILMLRDLDTLIFQLTYVSIS